jgi:hypothetical protein
MCYNLQMSESTSESIGSLFETAGSFRIFLLGMDVMEKRQIELYEMMLFCDFCRSGWGMTAIFV